MSEEIEVKGIKSTGLEKQMEKSLILEDHNFRVDSGSWKKMTIDGKGYLENPEEDIWEIPESGEQLFTREAAVRETKKAGKRMPSDEEFKIIQTKFYIPNLVLAGYRFADKSFAAQGRVAIIWSSSGNEIVSLGQNLASLNTIVDYSPIDRKCGFSVRCFKD